MVRLVVVTPQMHEVHHSDWREETDSNYSTVLSVWDRLARSFRMRDDPESIVFGLKEFTDPGWQSLGGMLKTPFTNPPINEAPVHAEACVTRGRSDEGTG